MFLLDWQLNHATQMSYMQVIHNVLPLLCFFYHTNVKGVIYLHVGHICFHPYASKFTTHCHLAIYHAVSLNYSFHTELLNK